jgi:DNA mismatch repair protein MutS
VLPRLRALGTVPPPSPLLRELTVELDPWRTWPGSAPPSPTRPRPSLQDGGVIRPGFSEELDDLRAVRDGARDFIASLQTRERERTGIASLKVGFNRVFGYYLEVTKANLDRVPTTTSGSRPWPTPSGTSPRSSRSGRRRSPAPRSGSWPWRPELFQELRRRVGRRGPAPPAAGADVARLDVLATLAEVAERQGYVRPELHTGFELEIRAGRHPVVETMMPREAFIPNDLVLDREGWIVVLTGPNMAGKSTVLRQVGLIQLLAQVGSFVPADRPASRSATGSSPGWGPRTTWPGGSPPSWWR